jgi:hypothetical protein
MSRSEDRKYFIVKHGLDAFEALPNRIWRTDYSERELPPRFDQVRPSDCWIAFAYTTSDRRERPLSLITGFFECTSAKAYYGAIPRRALKISDGETEAWFINGQVHGQQPHWPVAVPPISDLLEGRKFFNNQAIVPGISENEFERIRKMTLLLEFDTNTIPLLGRQPRCEQEVVSILVAGHKDLGIKEIIHVQTHFPDMLVNIGGDEVHLEIEIYSQGFWGHWDDLRRIPGVRGKRMARRKKDPGDNRPVACLCWVDNDKHHELRKSVRGLRVFELQSLLRTGEKIRL